MNRTQASLQHKGFFNGKQQSMSFNLPICSSLFHPKANFQAENVKARQVFQATIEVSIKLIIATSPTTLFLHSLLKLSRLSIIVHG